MDTSSIPGLELMQIADVVAREKSIEREEVIMAMEGPFKRQDGPNMEMIETSAQLIVKQDQYNSNWTEVVDEVEDDSTQMTGAEGESTVYYWRIPASAIASIEFGRIAQTAKQLLSKSPRS